MRVESPKRTCNGGYLHRLTDAPPWDGRRVARIVVRTGPTTDFGQLAAEYERAASDAGVSRLARRLGVSVESLRRLRVGWDGESWTFPMQDSAGRVVGIRRRLPDGRKLSVKGGREGLFIPDDLSDGGELYVCEGPTDTVAMLTLGLDAIGRPSCRGGVAELVGFVKARRPASVVIVGDGDAPGRAGAHVLAVCLRLHCPSVRVLYPPSGIKDARAWVQSGATRGIVERLAAAAEPVGLSINTRRRLG